MQLYYGSDRPIRTPSIKLSDIGKEFGIGFYAYLEEEPAQKQAALAVRKAFFFDSPRPVISQFNFDLERAADETKLLTFEAFDEAWLDFVFQCYTDIHFVHPYDIVIGNAVTAPVKEILERCRHGRINKSEAIAALNSTSPVKQICFTTVKALEYLHPIEE